MNLTAGTLSYTHKIEPIEKIELSNLQFICLREDCKINIYMKQIHKINLIDIEENDKINYIWSGNEIQKFILHELK